MALSGCRRGLAGVVLAGALLADRAGGVAAAPTQAYDSGDPTAAEQQVLELVNRARANPDAEGARLGIDIHEGLPDPSLVGPRPPLAMNKSLLGIARAHSQDMWTRNYFDHVNPDGLDPGRRMTAAGYAWTVAGENIAASSSRTPAGLEDLLMVDAGIAGRPHRVSLLDARAGTWFREAGIGAYAAAALNASGFKDFLTQDFGTSAAGPFLVGVVYNDGNANGFYDAGEGMAGATVMPDSGTFFATSAAAGGYAIPVATSGTLTVTASGGGITAPIVKTVTLSGVNVKLDFKASEAGTTTPGGTTTGSATGTTTGTPTGTAAASSGGGGGGGGGCFSASGGRSSWLPHAAGVLLLGCAFRLRRRGAGP